MATFGNTSHVGNNDWLNANQFLGTKFTSPSDAGTLTSISLYWNLDGSAINVKYLLYSSTGTLLASSSTISVNATGFISSPVSFALSPSTVYCLGVLFQTNPAGATAYDFVASGSSVDASGLTFASPGNVTFSTVNNYNLTIFGTYTPVSGGASHSLGLLGVGA